MNSALMFSKASDEWSTPQDVYDGLFVEFLFDLDVAATAENAKCPNWLGLDNGHDALCSSWGSTAITSGATHRTASAASSWRRLRRNGCGAC